MNAGMLDAAALTAAYRTEFGLEDRLSAPSAEVANAGAGPWWSILETIEALFCRASPSVSSYFYTLLGEDAADELDD